MSFKLAAFAAGVVNRIWRVSLQTLTRSVVASSNVCILCSLPTERVFFSTQHQ